MRPFESEAAPVSLAMAGKKLRAPEPQKREREREREARERERARVGGAAGAKPERFEVAPASRSTRSTAPEKKKRGPPRNRVLAQIAPPNRGDWLIDPAFNTHAHACQERPRTSARRAAHGAPSPARACAWKCSEYEARNRRRQAMEGKRARENEKSGVTVDW